MTEDIRHSDQIAFNLAAMAEALTKSPDYRVLRRMVPRDVSAKSNAHNTRTGILLDVETTGLDARRDEIIELAMLKFEYASDGTLVRVVDAFTAFNEPSQPIPPEITELTGITDEMVAGQKIDGGAVNAFVDDAVIVIAHNASFDRKFAERYWATFQNKAWGCSVAEVHWRKHGYDGSRLGYLLAGAGFFHQGHRAIDDCHALLEILALPLPKLQTTALAALLEQARKKTMRVWAEQSPFDLKDTLKRRGYRWSDGADGRLKSWYVDIEEAMVAEEISFLSKTIYLRDVQPRIDTFDAFSRYSARV